MERTARFSDKGKGQASSPHKPPDFIRRAAKPAEQSHRGDKPRVEPKSILIQESTSNLKEAKSKLKVEPKSISSKGITLNLKEFRSKLKVEPKSISSKGSSSNPKEFRSKPQKYRTSRLHERSFEVRWSSQKHRDAGQERRRLRGGGDGEDSSKSQSQNQEKSGKQAEATKSPIEQAADYINGLSLEDRNNFNSYKHAQYNPEGERIAKEHERILQQPF